MILSKLFSSVLLNLTIQIFLTHTWRHQCITKTVTHTWRQSWETMTSISAGHIILTPTQPVESGRPQRGSNPDLLTRSRALYRLSYRAPLSLRNKTVSHSYQRGNIKGRKICEHFIFSFILLSDNVHKKHNFFLLDSAKSTQFTFYEVSFHSYATMNSCTQQ